MKAEIEFDNLGTLIDFIANHFREATFYKFNGNKAKFEMTLTDKGKWKTTAILDCKYYPDDKPIERFNRMIEAAKISEGFVSIVVKE